MKVLVAVASKHGNTRGIGEAIGAALTDAGLEAEVRAPAAAADLDEFNAVIVGSGVYVGRWLPDARSFVERHADELRRLPNRPSLEMNQDERVPLPLAEGFERALDPPEQPMDPDLQRLLGELARGASPIPLSATDLPKLKELARRMTVAAGTWFFGLLACALVVLYAVKMWRRLAPSWARSGALPRVVYRAELDRISEVAIRRQPGESRESFANRIRDRLPSFGPLTAVHVEAAFGRQESDPRRLREAAAKVRRDLRSRFPFWKRFLGIITPWSWLRSK